jgi:hypothetical protein
MAPVRRESDLELEAVLYARSIGIRLQIKLNVTGVVGWPDRAFFKREHVLFIEFKRQGEKPRPSQIYMMDQLRAEGFRCEVCDNIEHAKQVLGSFLSEV